MLNAYSGRDVGSELSTDSIDKSARLRFAGVFVIFAAIAAAPFALGNLALHLAVSGGLLALAAMPLTVLVGSAGLPSLGTAAFLCIGAFTAGILSNSLGLGLLPAVAVSAVLGLLSGTIVAATTLRVSGLYLAVGTLALQRAIGVVATDLDLKLTYAAGFMLDDPILFGIHINSLQRWWTLIAPLMCVVYVAFRYLQLSHVGREWALLRTHPAAAAALGISITKSRIQVFALTSTIIAIIGVISAYHLSNVQAGILYARIGNRLSDDLRIGQAGKSNGCHYGFLSDRPVAPNNPIPVEVIFHRCHLARRGFGKYRNRNHPDFSAPARSPTYACKTSKVEIASWLVLRKICCR
ncbi:MAG: branched-chain amino acid ABC transporter permease [Hyphomicrobium sp.]|uniref:branched-chain amino acid ABC transporter permease n=1 Tax=Hyphomicrobium sp. TaxID=82 RepID=UPI0039E3F8E0